MRRLASRSRMRTKFPLLTMLSVCFVGCGHAPPEPPGTITFLIETMPANLDPRIGTDARSAQLTSLLFSGLLERDATMNVRGD